MIEEKLSDPDEVRLRKLQVGMFIAGVRHTISLVDSCHFDGRKCIKTKTKRIKRNVSFGSLAICPIGCLLEMFKTDGSFGIALACLLFDDTREKRTAVNGHGHEDGTGGIALPHAGRWTKRRENKQNRLGTPDTYGLLTIEGWI
jgi:hypothetical protein